MKGTVELHRAQSHILLDHSGMPPQGACGTSRTFFLPKFLAPEPCMTHIFHLYDICGDILHKLRLLTKRNPLHSNPR